MLDNELYKKILYFNSRTAFTAEELFKEIGAEKLMELYGYIGRDEKVAAFLNKCQNLNISFFTHELETKIKEILKLDTITEEALNSTFSPAEKIYIIFSYEFLCAELKNKCKNINFLDDDLAVSLLQNGLNLNDTEMIVNFIQDDTKLIPLFKQMSKRDVYYLFSYREKPLSSPTIQALLSVIPLDDDEYGYHIKDVIIKHLDLDTKIDYINNNNKDRIFVSELIASLSTDLKLKYLNKVHRNYRTRVIKSIEEDDIKVKFITLTAQDKGEIIASLKDDVLKESLLLKYKMLLNSEELGQIIASFNDIKYVEKNLYLLRSEKSKVTFVKYADNDKNHYKIAIFNSLKKKKSIIDSIYVIHNSAEKLDYIKRINDQDILKKLFIAEDEECNHLIMQKLNEKNREKIIKDERENYNDVFCFYQYLENDSFLYESILHTLYFPEYDKSYDNMLARLANQTHFNKERLIKLVSTFDMSVLSKLENPNIIALLNSSNEDFDKIIALFSKEMIEFDENNQNDALNAIIQRKFRITHPNDILIFTNTLHAVIDGDEKLVRELIDIVSKIVSLEKFSITKEELIAGLMAKDEAITKKYNQITNEYLAILRADFDIEEKALANKMYNDIYYDKNSLTKYVYKNLSIDNIMSFIKKSTDDPRERMKFTEEELALVADWELLQQVITYKSNPQSFKEIPKEVKEKIKITEEIIKKTFDIYRFALVKKNSQVKPTLKRELLEVLSELDVDQTIKTVLNDKEKYQELLELLQKKKIHCWLGRFGELPNESDIDLHPAVIASLISNYSEIRKHVFKEEANKTKTIINSFLNDYKDKNIEELLLEGLKNPDSSKNDTIKLVKEISQTTKIPVENLIKKLLASAKIYRNDNLETAINVLNPEIKSQFNKEYIKQVLDKINNLCWVLSYDSVIKPSPISPTEKELNTFINLINQVHNIIPDLSELLILENLIDSTVILNSIGEEEALANINKKIKEKYSDEDLIKLLSEVRLFIKNMKKTNIVSSTVLLDIANCYDSNSKTLRMLFGRENFDLIKRNPRPYSGDYTSSQRIKVALDLVKELHEREYVTVPPSREIYDLSNNKKIQVSVGDLHDLDNLTYGERTGACMRIGGAGYSLFNFCLKNENGFHVKFTDPENDKIVSRVSGFRNGNTVFLNQLRYSLSEKYTDENLVQACRLFARKLIDDTKDSRYPIQNVVISPDYAMRRHLSEVKNLGHVDIQKGFRHFYTDVDENSIILATSNPDNYLVPIKTGPNATEKYKSLRRVIKRAYGLEACMLKNQILLLDQHYSNANLDDIEINEKEDIIYAVQGEDWYITIDSKGQIENYIMKNSKDKKTAVEEISIELEKLKEQINTYGLQDIEEHNIKGGM